MLTGCVRRLECSVLKRCTDYMHTLVDGAVFLDDGVGSGLGGRFVSPLVAYTCGEKRRRTRPAEASTTGPTRGAQCGRGRHPDHRRAWSYDGEHWKGANLLCLAQGEVVGAPGELLISPMRGTRPSSDAIAQACRSIGLLCWYRPSIGPVPAREPWLTTRGGGSPQYWVERFKTRRGCRRAPSGAATRSPRG